MLATEIPQSTSTLSVLFVVVSQALVLCSQMGTGEISRVAPIYASTDTLLTKMLPNKQGCRPLRCTLSKRQKLYARSGVRLVPEQFSQDVLCSAHEWELQDNLAIGKRLFLFSHLFAKLCLTHARHNPYNPCGSFINWLIVRSRSIVTFILLPLSLGTRELIEESYDSC
jgi:hypothetical protein